MPIGLTEAYRNHPAPITFSLVEATIAATVASCRPIIIHYRRLHGRRDDRSDSRGDDRPVYRPTPYMTDEGLIIIIL